MDGNGRWASKRGLPRSAGHTVGAANFKKITRYCSSIGIRYLTVYAFSTENWKRPMEEVRTIMRLLGKYLHEAIETMERGEAQMLAPLTADEQETLITLLRRVHSALRQEEGGFPCP